MPDSAADPHPDSIPMQFHHRMNDADALMWSIEKDPMLRSTITSVAMLDGRIDPSAIRALFERASRLIPRFRQRVRSNPLSVAPPRWEVDPNFDLSYHLRFVRSPGSGCLQDILALAEPIAMQSFDRARPLWECTYVEADNGKSALILKIHHSITDGVGGVKLMLEVFDFEQNAVKSPMPDAPEVHVLNQVQRFADAFVYQMRRQLDAVKNVAGTAGATALEAATHPFVSIEAAKAMAESMGRLLKPALHPGSPIMTERSLSTHFDVIQLPLEPMKAAGHAVGGKLNDAFVGGILLGIRHYHTQRGSELHALRMSMPINLRTDHDEDVAGNSFVPARFEIPVDTDDARTLMQRTHERLFDVVHEPANAVVEPLANAINRLPTTFSTAFFGSMMKGLDFQASNVPGSPFQLYLCGVPVTLMVPFGPMAGAGANITLLSYVDEINIGVNVDPAAVTNPAQFVACLRQAYDDIMAVGAPRTSSSTTSSAGDTDGAGSSASSRRAPARKTASRRTPKAGAAQPKPKPKRQPARKAPARKTPARKTSASGSSRAANREVAGRTSVSANGSSRSRGGSSSRGT